MPYFLCCEKARIQRNPITIKNTFVQHHKVPVSSMLAFYIMHSVINNHHQTKSLFINVLCLRPEPGGSLTESPVHANVISSHLSTSWAHASAWDWAPAKLYHLISRLMPASEGEGGRDMLVILGFQPIYKVCIGNYLVPTCPPPPSPRALCVLLKPAGHDGGKGGGWRQREWDMLLYPEELCFSHCSLSYFLPLYPLWHFLSLFLPPTSSSFPPPVFIYQSCHSPSLPPIFTSTLSVFLSFSLSVVLFFILSSSVCHLYSGGTWCPRTPVKYNCRYVCVCVHSYTHMPACLLVLWQYALTQSDLHK